MSYETAGGMPMPQGEQSAESYSAEFLREHGIDEVEASREVEFVMGPDNIYRGTVGQMLTSSRCPVGSMLKMSVATNGEVGMSFEQIQKSGMRYVDKVPPSSQELEDPKKNFPPQSNLTQKVIEAASTSNL